jgi:hypothetical protein
LIFCFVLQIITEHPDEILICKISCYQDSNTGERAIQEEIPLFLLKLQQWEYTKDSSYDHEAINLKQMHQTAKTMMMKLDASDEMIECHGEQWIFVLY